MLYKCYTNVCVCWDIPIEVWMNSSTSEEKRYIPVHQVRESLQPSVVHNMGGGPRVVVSTAAFHARFRGSVPGLGGLKETKNVSSPSTCESQYCGEPP